MYLNCVDKFIEIAEISLSLLDGVQHPRLIKQALLEGCICHHDYSYQNILIKGPTTYITGFESCCEEIRIYDLVNLIRRKMRKCDWDFEKAVMLLGAYQKVAPLSSDEIHVMKAMLLFPQKFWRVATATTTLEEAGHKKFYQYARGGNRRVQCSCKVYEEV